mgnify:CR=1 FL=1
MAAEVERVCSLRTWHCGQDGPCGRFGVARQECHGAGGPPYECRSGRHSDHRLGGWVCGGLSVVKQIPQDGHVARAQSGVALEEAENGLPRLLPEV